MAHSEWQLIRTVCIEDVGYIVGRASPFVRRIVVIQERLETGLLITQRITQNFRERVVRLDLQALTVTPARLDLQRIECRITYVAGKIGTEHIGIRKEINVSV